MCQRSCSGACHLDKPGCVGGSLNNSEYDETILREKTFLQNQRLVIQKKRDHLDNRIYMVRGSFFKQSWL